MNNQLEQRLQQYLDYIDQGVEQLPLFVNEYLAWYAFAAIVWAIVGAVGTILCILLICLLIKYTGENDDPFVPFVVLIVALALCLCMTGTNIMCYAKIQIAPRVIIADEIKSILKEAK